MDRRTQKQLTIGFIFVLIIGSAAYGLIDKFFIIEATCFDKTQNGKEEGVDCGLIACRVACESAIMPLNMLSQKLIEVRPGDYDFVTQVNNPNSLFGASRVKYELNLTDADSEKLFQKTGTFYILPGQTRFIIIPNIRSDKILADTLFDIREVEWQKVETFEDISFPLQRKIYTAIDKKSISSELEAVTLNNSDFNFDKVEVGVILFDDNNDIVAVNRTDIRTFLSRTERYFKVNWPVQLPASVTRQDIEVLTNVFENSNFIKRYGTQERFQKYY